MFDLLLLAESAEAIPGWMRLLNINHRWEAAWVGLGLAGQFMFFCRMGLQWIASERKGQSVVPPAFWWCSIAGASMLLGYFIWRWDIVGMLGQSFGFLVYWRNIYFIYGRNQPVSIADDVDPEPELAEPHMTARTVRNRPDRTGPSG